MNAQVEEVAEQNAYGEFENVPENGAAEALVEEAAGYGEAAPVNTNNGSNQASANNGSNGSNQASAINGSNANNQASANNGSNGSNQASANNGSNANNQASANNGSNGSNQASANNGSNGSNQASANNGANNSVAAGRVRTVAEQKQLNERQAMHSEMVESFKQAFGDNAKAPKPAFTAAGTMLKIRKEQGENAYEQAMSNYLARAQNKYYGYSKKGATAKVRAAQPARYNTGGIVGNIRQAKTRKNVIRALETALEALRLENGAAAPAVAPRPVSEAPAAAAPKSKARKTAKKASAATAAKSKSRSRSARAAKSKSRSRSASSAKKPAAVKPAGTGQGAISVARAALAAAAGVKIPQKIAAPFAKWAKDKNQPTINSKQAEIAAALKDRAGRNDNSIAVELGLKTQENVEKRRQQVLRNQARMAAAKAAAAKAKE